MEKDFAIGFVKMGVQIVAKGTKCGRTKISNEVPNEILVKPSKNFEELANSLRIRYDKSTMGDGQIKLSVKSNKANKEIIIRFI